jgi:putative transposase
MNDARTLPCRKSIRLKGYDYSAAGAYFVTICTQRRERDESHQYMFGEVVDGVMRLNPAGEMARDAWDGLPARYANVELDAFVVMPNHVHGIIVLMDVARAGACRGVINHARTLGEMGAANRRAGAAGVPSLGEVVRAFKAVSAHLIRQSIAPGIPIWQRNYFEQIIRNQDSMNRVRSYIQANPARWHTGRNHNHDTGGISVGQNGDNVS